MNKLLSLSILVLILTAPMGCGMLFPEPNPTKVTVYSVTKCDECYSHARFIIVVKTGTGQLYKTVSVVENFTVGDEVVVDLSNWRPL